MRPQNARPKSVTIFGLILLVSIAGCASTRSPHSIILNVAESHPRPNPSHQNCPFTALALEGTGTNLLANRTTGVKMQITCSQGVLRAVGKYDSVKLFGRFDIGGSFSAACPGENDKGCMDFLGDLLLGDDGSNFPSGTRAPYTMKIGEGPNGWHGTYAIGIIPFLIPEVQNGILNLRSGAGS